MSANAVNATMAVFLDLENIALGARDARYPTFDIQKVLERLLLKGHIQQTNSREDRKYQLWYNVFVILGFRK